MNILRFIIPKSLVEYIDSDSTVRQGLEKMKYHRYVAIPVLDTLRNDDIYKHFMERGMTEQGPAGRASVMEILDTGYLRPLIHSASFEELFDRVKEHNFVPVVDDRGCFIGLILRRNVMDYLWECYKRRES